MPWQHPIKRTYPEMWNHYLQKWNRRNMEDSSYHICHVTYVWKIERRTNFSGIWYLIEGHTGVFASNSSATERHFWENSTSTFDFPCLKYIMDTISYVIWLFSVASFCFRGPVSCHFSDQISQPTAASSVFLSQHQGRTGGDFEHFPATNL